MNRTLILLATTVGLLIQAINAGSQDADYQYGDGKIKTWGPAIAYGDACGTKEKDITGMCLFSDASDCPFGCAAKTGDDFTCGTEDQCEFLG